MSDQVPTIIPGGQVLRTDLSGGRVRKTVLSGGQVLRTDLSGGVAPVSTAPVPVLPAWLTHAFSVLDITASDLDPVTTWTDPVSGDSFTGTGTQRPSYRTAAVPYLEWDGIDDYMVSTIGNAQPNTLILLCDPVVAGSQRFWLDGVGATRNVVYTFPSGLHYLFAGTAERNTGVASTDTPQMTGGVFDGASSFFRKNLTDTAVLTPGAAAMGSLRIGRNLGAGSMGFRGKLYGVFLAMGHAATAGELDDLHTYCQAQFPGVL